MVSSRQAEAIARELNDRVSTAAYQSALRGRVAGANALAKQFGFSTPEIGLASRMGDMARAKRLGQKIERDWLRKLTPANDAGSLLVPAKAEGRLLSIATTETARAFDLERQTIARERLAPNYGLIEVWDATLDKRTCSRCGALHGTQADAQGFAGGQRPGQVHPRCRCVSHYELVGGSRFNLLPYVAAGATYGWLK